MMSVSSFFARMALRIAFRPLRVQPVPVPPELAVVIADSGVRAEKGGAAQRAYNERVAECARAAAVFGVPPGGLLADLPGKGREQPPFHRMFRYVHLAPGCGAIELPSDLDHIRRAQLLLVLVR